MSWLSDLVSMALYTIFMQNLVLSGGYGTSEALRVSTKPRRFLLFAAMLTYFSILTSLLCGLLDSQIDNIPALYKLPATLRIALYGLVLVAVFLLTVLLLRVTIRPSNKFISTLGMAALNTLVFAIPFLNRQAGYSLVESLGSGLGAGAAFVLAAALMSAGLARLSQNDGIPAAFRGAPAMFLYVALISLAFLGLSGHTVFA